MQADFCRNSGFAKKIVCKAGSRTNFGPGMKKSYEFLQKHIDFRKKVLYNRIANFLSKEIST